MGIIKELTDVMEIIKNYCDKRNYWIKEGSDNNDGCTLGVRAWDNNSIVHQIKLSRLDETIRIEDTCVINYGHERFFNNGEEVLHSNESQASQKDC